uniref:Conotoxin n=2 Tax=Steinernema glaseri TaxID=37863 RepID=A0A1I7YU39_9BILA
MPSKTTLFSLLCIFAVLVAVGQCHPGASVLPHSGAMEQYCCTGHFACMTYCQQKGCKNANCGSSDRCIGACNCSNCRSG